MALGSLIVRLGLDAAEFVDGMSKSEYKASQFVKNTTASMARLSGVYTAISGAAVGAVTALNAIVDKVAAYQDLADVMGSTAENVASLQRAADLAGTSMETIASSSARLSSLMADINGTGKDAAAALAAMGINVEEFRKLDPVEQFEKIAMSLGEFEDGAAKTAAAIEIFGRAGAQLMPVMQDLYEEGGRLVTLTQEQIEEADKFNRRYAEIQSILRTTAQTIATNSLPAFEALLEHIGDLIEDASTLGNNHMIEDFAFGSAKALAILVESLGVVLKGIRALAGSFETVWADLMVASTFVNSGGIPGMLFEKNRQALKDALDKRNKTLEEANKRYSDLWNQPVDAMSKAIQARWDTAKQMRNVGVPLPSIDDWDFNFRKQLVLPEKPPEETPEAKKAKADADKAAAAAKAAADRARAEVKSYIESLKKAEEAAADLSHYEQLMWDISEGRLKGMTKGEQEYAINLAKTIDATKAAEKAEKERAEQAKKDAADVKTVLDDMRATTERNDAMLKSLADGWRANAVAIEDARDPLRKFIRDLEQIDMLVAKGFLKPEEATKIKGLMGEDPNKKSKDDMDAMAEYAKNAAQLIQKSMADFLFDPFADGTEDMVDNFGKALQRMLAEASTAQLMKALFGDFGKTGEIGGWIGSFMKGTTAASAGTSGTVLPLPESGTPPKLAAGTNYVPYDGMKAILHRGEAVVPAAYNQAAMGSAGGISVNVNMGESRPSGDIPPMEFQRMLRSAVVSGLQEARRRGAAL